MREVEGPGFMVDLVAGEEQGVWEELVDLQVHRVRVGGVVVEGDAICCEGNGVRGGEGVEVDLLADFGGQVEEGERHFSVWILVELCECGYVRSYCWRRGQK